MSWLCVFGGSRSVALITLPGVRFSSLPGTQREISSVLNERILNCVFCKSKGAHKYSVTVPCLSLQTVNFFFQIFMDVVIYYTCRTYNELWVLLNLMKAFNHVLIRHNTILLVLITIIIIIIGSSSLPVTPKATKQ